jgi:outer membrane protein assembly factor BamB
MRHLRQGKVSQRISLNLGLSIILWVAMESVAQDRDVNFNLQQQAVEAAQYLYRIEGDIIGAKQRLENVIAGSNNEEVLAQARFLLGRILEKEGDRDSSLSAYKFALANRGLPNTEKLWLYRRLTTQSPGSITPMILDKSSQTGPSRIFMDRLDNQTIYALEFRGPPDGQWERTKELALQNNEGDLTRLDLELSNREELLDANGSQALIFNPEAKKISLRPFKGGNVWQVTAPAKVETGGILTAAPGSFVLVGAGVLRSYSQGKVVWETPLDQEGCTWIPTQVDKSQGILQCAENQIILVDARKKSLRSLVGIKDKALQLTYDQEFLAIRYIDRFEIRKGAGFATVKWGIPSQLQEKLILGNGYVYLVSPKGLVKSYQLESGQLEWQRDVLASQLIAYDGVIFATTFAQTVACLDLHGKPIWNYEYGWDREPVLLPNESWLVLQFGDGRRIKLNRELLRITGNGNGFKFMEFRAKETEKDWKGALTSLGQVLNLEPGNGEAWKLRSLVLKNMGGPRQEQIQSLIEASRSQETPSWSKGAVLKSLSTNLGASWIWKRQFGPKFYPNLIPHKDNSFYLENDNQTLVLLNHETGELINSFHFSEELDMKVSLWKNDTICVSSPSRLYLLSPTLIPGGLSQFPLKNPVCQAQAINGGLVYSDWYGGLNMIGLPDRTLRWERKLGQSGLLVGKTKSAEYLDVIDLEGNYFAIQPNSGKVLWSLKLPSGTITETFSNKDFIYAGYNQGTLVCIDRNRQAKSWTIDFGEQIFSLSGNKDNTLVLTTASKKLICVQAATGTILSQVRIQSYLFNRPTVIDHGYWLGTTEPALEKRNFNHELILKYKLPDLPGSPVMFGNSIFIGTLDNFILCFPS